jgi:hypothetical protein
LPGTVSGKSRGRGQIRCLIFFARDQYSVKLEQTMIHELKTLLEVAASPICAECGWLLTPADEGVCPECAEKPEHEGEGRR